jgi:ribosomal protein L6P/L9E
VNLEMDDKEIRVVPQDDGRLSRAYWGLTRTLVANMVTGVSQGFSRVMEIVGTGYKVEAKGDTLVFSLGYSPPTSGLSGRRTSIKARACAMPVRNCAKRWGKRAAGKFWL